MTRRRSYEEVYVVVRVDHEATLDHGDPEADGPSIAFAQYSVTVKEIVRSLDEARREVSRLNELNREKGCRYFWQGTHYFPDGGSLGSGPGNAGAA